VLWSFGVGTHTENRRGGGSQSNESRKEWQDAKPLTSTAIARPSGTQSAIVGSTRGLVPACAEGLDKPTLARSSPKQTLQARING